MSCHVQADNAGFRGLPQEVKKVFGANLGPGWPVIYAFEDTNGNARQWIRGAASSMLATPFIPEEARGILLLVEPEARGAAKNLIAGFNSANERAPPIAVMFRGPREIAHR